MSCNTKVDENSKIPWIDSLKGIAILGIVSAHCGGSGNKYLDIVIGNGPLGVQMFFVISAFLAYISMERSFGDSVNIKNVRQWWVRKFIRLIPMYLLSVFVYTFLFGGNKYWLGSAGKVSILNIVTHIFFLHGINPYYINSILGVEWYLAVLALFYILAPLIYKYINTLEKGLMLFIAVTLVSYYIIKVGKSFCPIADAYIWNAYIGYFGFFTQVPILVIGIILYFTVKRMRVSLTIKENRALSYSILLFSINILIGTLLEANRLFHISGYTLVGAIFFCICLSQEMHCSPLLVNKLFAQLGKYSYPIFLNHFLFKNVFEKTNLGGGSGIVFCLLKVCVVMVSSYLAACILTKWVDKPIIKLMEKVLKLEQRN